MISYDKLKDSLYFFERFIPEMQEGDFANIDGELYEYKSGEWVKNKGED